MGLISILVLGMAIGAVVFYVTVSGVRVSARDVAWLSAVPQVLPAEQTVYARYLERHRRHRLAGGLFGVVFAVTIGVRWFGALSIGIGEGSPLADVLFCGLAGILLGALAAERFRLSEPTSPKLAASLSEREDVSRPDLRWTARGITLGALGVGLLVSLTGNGLVPMMIGVGGLVALVVAEATQTAISSRRRPVLSDSAKTVDLRIRSFAGRSAAWLQLAASVLVAGWTIAKVPGLEEGWLSFVRFVLVIGSLAGTVALLRKAAPRPPRKWQAGVE